jgi:hypothetical protein
VLGDLLLNNTDRLGRGKKKEEGEEEGLPKALTESSAGE